MESAFKYLLLPSTLIALSAIGGLVLFCIRHTRKGGISLSIIAFSLYTCFGSGPVAFLLLGHLEYQVPPSTAWEREGIDTIVVLAEHAESDLAIPQSSRVSNGTAFRLLEAISVFSSAPDSTVIVSGGGVVPVIMHDILVSSGLPEGHIRVDANSSSTFESAINLSSTLRGMPFALVTSAGHMPRAMGVFQKAGMIPRAIPTHYMTKHNWLAIQYFPSPLHLGYSDLAVSEYAALLWYRLKGWL